MAIIVARGGRDSYPPGFCSGAGNLYGWRRRRGGDSGSGYYTMDTGPGAGHGGSWPRETNLSLRAVDAEGTLALWDDNRDGVGQQRAYIDRISKHFGGTRRSG